MANSHGTPIWYELQTPDLAGSRAFYESVIGWTIGDVSGQPGMDYRMIEAADGAQVGGVMPLDDGMVAGGARPTWLFYVGVDDVDTTARLITEKGGSVAMAPFDIPGAGRAALVADPQGIPFYIMRGSSDADSTAWDREAMGRCNWNELATPDHAAGNSFYADVFGWTYPDSMPMGEMGNYVFVETGGQTIGATMRQGVDQPPGWLFYFGAPDTEVAAERVRAGGGRVDAGPMEVPGGNRIIVASDPHGVPFGVVGPGAGEQ